jgi:hypothetical protein
MRVGLFLAICTGDIPADIHAEPLGDGWRVSVPVSLSSNTLIQSNANDTFTFQSVSASTGFDLASKRSAWSGGFFIDRHFSKDEPVDGMVNTGAFVKYRFGRWDTTAVIVSSKPQGQSGILLYGNRLRYRVADGHKLGIQTMAPLSGPDSTIVMLRYDGTISSRLAINVAAGTSVSGGRQHIASVELVWDVF